MKKRVKARVVYVLHIVGTDIYKVGCTTRSVRDRLKEVSSSIKESVEFVGAVMAHNGLETETRLKRMLKPCIHHGTEWFSLDKNSLETLVSMLRNSGERATPDDYILPPEPECVLQIVLTGEVVRYLDECVVDMDRRTPGIRHNRQDVVRALLGAAILKRNEKRA